MQKQAVVSGGTKGIGLAICASLLENGFRVFSISRTEGDSAPLKSRYPEQFTTLYADLSVKSEVQRVTGFLKEQILSLDVLVNNAGVFMPGDIETEADADFELQMALNLNAPYYLTKSLLPMLRLGDKACIFNICSTAGIMAYPNGASYCISKHALLGLSRVLRETFKNRGVLVSTVIPGATDTDSWKGSGLPPERFIKPETIASAVLCAWNARDNADFEEILIRPRAGDV